MLFPTVAINNWNLIDKTSTYSIIESGTVILLGRGGGVSLASHVSTYLSSTFGRGWMICWWGGGGCDCCLCDCGTEKAVSILGLNCKAFTPAWLGGRPPAIWAPQICRLLAAAGRSWRSFAPPSWVHPIDATSFCYPLLLHLLLVLFFFSVTELLSLRLRHKLWPVWRWCNRCDWSDSPCQLFDSSVTLFVSETLEELWRFLVGLLL